MERSEPTFVPEWLKGATGGVTGGGSLNHHFSSSLHSDDHVTGISSRNRLSVSSCDHDSPRTLAFTDKPSSSSYRRSTSSNGSLSHDKDSSTHSRPYSSFGRSHRDRDREKGLDFHDRERSIILDNGYRDFPDSLITSRSNKDTLRRSQSMVSGRQVESWPKRTGNGTNNGVRSSGSMVSSIHKASFERDFPSLGSEDKLGPPEIGRSSSPGLSPAVQGLPLGSSTIIGGDGWTSALAEVPVIIGGNGPLLSSVQQIAPASSSSTAPSTTTGLNMAETLAQVPLRTRTAPQLSVETQRLEELAIKQSRQLIPMTPSMPKASVISSEKLKPRCARSGDFSALSKAGHHSSSQPVNHSLRGSARSDISKTSQVGNFQVLNRERNGISPTARDGPSPTNATRVLNPLGIVPSSAAIVPPLKSPDNVKNKADSKAAALSVSQSSFPDKRSLSQAKNRNDFFNSLRKKTSPNHSTAIPQPSSVDSSILEQSDELITVASTSVVSQAKNPTASNSDLDSSKVNDNSFSGNCDVCGEPEKFPPTNAEQSSCSDPVVDFKIEEALEFNEEEALEFNEEEALEFNEEETRFMRSLGWNGNAGVEALTAEEINAFIERYGKCRPFSKLCRRQLRQAKTVLPEAGGSSAGLNSFDSETEV